MWIDLDKKLSDYKTINLTELNSKASFLKRIDRKFLLTWKQLKNILNNLKENFCVLEIKWKKIFSYDNIYMDTEDYMFYKQHQNNESPRIKVRTRLYKDSSTTFFEYKQKANWMTTKYRYNIPIKEHWKMTIWEKKIFEWIWKSNYTNWEKIPNIFPSIITKYKRITLVDKMWWERLTIDFDIKIVNLRDAKNKIKNENNITLENNLWWKEINLKNLVIIESKSLNENCKSIDIIKSLWIEQANSCSKYSLWIIYSWLTKKYETFKETIKEIEKIQNEIK